MSQYYVILFLIVLSACSTKSYVNPGTPNFTVNLKEDSTFLIEKVKLHVYIYEHKPKYEVQYLGAVKVNAKKPAQISLPVGKVYAIKTFVLQDGWFRSKSITHDDPFAISPQSSKAYTLDVEVENREIGRNYLVSSSEKEKQKELERVPDPKNCKYEYQWVYYH